MSPIKGLLDTPRLPRVGKIKLGIKMEKGNPKATDYFVVPLEVQQALNEEKPQKLRIAFPCEETEVFAPYWYKRYSSLRGLMCKGDGESARRLCEVAKVIDQNGVLPDDKHPRFWPLPGKEAGKTAWFDIKCPPDSCDEYLRKQCLAKMNLQFLLLDVPGLGVWQIDTGSWESMRNILNTVDHIKQYGKISLIPLILSLEAEEAAPDGVKKKVYILHLTAPYSLAQLYEYLKLPPGRALLPDPDTEAPDDITSEAGSEESLEGSNKVEEDIFGEQAIEERDKNLLWKDILDLLKDVGHEKDSLLDWFKKKGVKVTQALGETSPKEVTKEMLTTLRDNLKAYKVSIKKAGTDQGKLI